jgi:hypothetical protein
LKALLLLLMLGMSVAAGACSTTTRAQAPQDQPTLVVPPVPPRVIDPPRPTEPATIEAVPDLPTPPASLPRPKPTRDPKGGESKPDANKPETPDPATSQPAPAQPVPPLRSLTLTGADAPETVRQIRDTINRVDVTLKTVHYPGLSNDRKANYDAAKGWAKQAEEALDKNDLVLAKSLADRADTIAKQLAGR